jgi:hypothetical protein
MPFPEQKPGTLTNTLEKIKSEKVAQNYWPILAHSNWPLTTFKKTLKAAEPAREDVRLQRDAWHKMQPRLDPARLVFIDETGLDTAMVRRYG